MTRPSPTSLRAAAALLGLGLALRAHAAPGLSLEDAVRAAWTHNEALEASRLGAAAARVDAESAQARWYPELQLQARALRTDEPMMAFGTRLDQGRITAADFDPARLNDPAAIGGYHAGATLTQVLYGGGRISAGRRAADAIATAEARDHERRGQVIAAQVVEAYFGAQVADVGVAHARDVLDHAAETERFVRARAADGAALASEVARATAFRAQAEAELTAAEQRLATARSALGLLAGAEAAGAALTTPVEPGGAGTDAGAPAAPAAAPSGAARDVAGSDAAHARPDIAATRARGEAADAAVSVARGALLPEVFAQASAETARSADLADGTAWTTLMVGMRWKLGASDAKALAAARARRDASTAMVRWQERQADREVEEARRAVGAADARVRAATEAAAASEAARELREARHRQGLLPLTDVLDAQAGLAGARALLLRSRLEARTARAQLQLALGEDIEGITP